MEYKANKTEGRFEGGRRRIYLELKGLTFTNPCIVIQLWK